MARVASFDLTVRHSQICVYDPSLEMPGNDWQDQHDAQGFTWRPYSVSFRTIGSDDKCNVEVWSASEISIQSDTIRAIVVPFSVPQSEMIAVTNAISYPEHNIQLASGNHTLIFEYGFREEYWEDPKYQELYALFVPTWCRLTFILDYTTEPQVLRADKDLSPVYPLLMEAEPA